MKAQDELSFVVFVKTSGWSFQNSLTCRYWHRIRNNWRYKRHILHHLRWKSRCPRQIRTSSLQCRIEPVPFNGPILFRGCYSLAIISPTRMHPSLTRLDKNSSPSGCMTTVRTLVQERRMLRGEACAEGRYQSQIKALHGCFQRAMFERNSKAVAYARRNLLAE